MNIFIYNVNGDKSIIYSIISTLSRVHCVGGEMKRKIFSNQCQAEEGRQPQQKVRLRHNISLGLIVLREPKKFVLVIHMTCCYQKNFNAYLCRENVAFNLSSSRFLSNNNRDTY